MRIDIGAPVVTRDGNTVGTIDRVVLNPDSKEVDSVVVRRGLLLNRDVVVPLSMVEYSDEGGLHLRIGSIELAELPDFVEEHYTMMQEQARIPYPYTPGSILFPLGPSYGAPAVPAPYDPSLAEGAPPPFDVEIAEGTEVRALDAVLGFVDEVLTDPQTDRASDIVVRKGVGLSKDTRIPIEYVSEITEDHIQLTVTLEQVEDLPMPLTDKYLTVEGNEKRKGKR